MFVFVFVFIGGFGIQELLLIGFLVLLFFGGKKIPELMKGMGRGIRSFKEGMNGREKEKTDFWLGKREAN